MNKLYTPGHSTQTFEQFLALLKAHEIQRSVDICTIPKSRRKPAIWSRYTVRQYNGRIAPTL